MSRLKVAWTLTGVGAALVVVATGYVAFATWSVARSERLTVSVPAAAQADWFSPSALAGTSPGKTVVPEQGDPSSTDGDEATAGLAVRSGPTVLFPAQFINPKYWAAPLWAASDPFEGPSLENGFERLKTRGEALARGTSSAATRVVIPAIGVDSPVRDLEQVDDGGVMKYEPVDHFVGRIPGTALPGEIGTGWYFGHLESPGLGEGNVFNRFPEIPRLIKEDPLEVLIYTGSAVFAYRVTGTQIVRAEDLQVSDSTDSRVALVASFPPLVYTHRLVVYAELYARKLLEED